MTDHADVIAGLQIHPLCAAIPEMDEHDYAGLRSSIQENGYDKNEPVIIHEGMILDGRHRVHVCVELGVRFATAPWDGTHGTPENFVMAKNVHRRHLTDLQRKTVATVFILPEQRKLSTARMLDGPARTSHPRTKMSEDAAGAPDRAEDATARIAGLKSGRDLPTLEKAFKANPELVKDVMSKKLKTVADVKRAAGHAPPKLAPPRLAPPLPEKGRDLDVDACLAAITVLRGRLRDLSVADRDRLRTQVLAFAKELS